MRLRHRRWSRTGMGWGASTKRCTSGAKPTPALIMATATLLLASTLRCASAIAAADCPAASASVSTADAAVGRHSTSSHSASLPVALHGAPGAPGTASSPASCHRGGGALEGCQDLSPSRSARTSSMGIFQLPRGAGPQQPRRSGPLFPAEAPLIATADRHCPDRAGALAGI